MKGATGWAMPAAARLSVVRWVLLCTIISVSLERTKAAWPFCLDAEPIFPAYIYIPVTVHTRWYRASMARRSISAARCLFVCRHTLQAHKGARQKKGNLAEIDGNCVAVLNFSTTHYSSAYIGTTGWVCWVSGEKTWRFTVNSCRIQHTHRDGL